MGYKDAIGALHSILYTLYTINACVLLAQERY